MSTINNNEFRLILINLLQQQPPFYGHYTGQPALAGTSSKELEDSVSVKFYCPHALADINQHIRIGEKMLEFSSTALSTLFCTSKYDK